MTSHFSRCSTVSPSSSGRKDSVSTNCASKRKWNAPLGWTPLNTPGRMTSQTRTRAYDVIDAHIQVWRHYMTLFFNGFHVIIVLRWKGWLLFDVKLVSRSRRDALGAESGVAILLLLCLLILSFLFCFKLGRGQGKSFKLLRASFQRVTLHCSDVTSTENNLHVTA